MKNLQLLHILQNKGRIYFENNYGILVVVNQQCILNIFYAISNSFPALKVRA